MHVDHQIKASGAKLPPEPQIFVPAAPAAGTGCDEYVVEMWVVLQNGSGFGFDEIRNRGLRKAPAQRANCGRREHDVANQPWPDQKNLHQSDQLSAIS